MMVLQGKVAMVVHGSHGIGRAASLLLAARGAKVVVHDSSHETSGEEVAACIRSAGGTAMAYRADLQKAGQASKLVAAAIEAYGQIDVLVMGADRQAEPKLFTELSWDTFADKLHRELKAAFVTAQAVIPVMAEQESGRIIYISSTLGKDPSPCMIAHGTAMGALNTFCTYIAQEFGPAGITANVVATGYVHTVEDTLWTTHAKDVISGFTPLGRVAVPEDVARVIAFLASDDAQFLTGTYTPVTGGLSME